MSATIHRLPVRPSPRLAAQTVPPITNVHFDRELHQIALSLHEATGHFGMITTEPVASTALPEGAEALEAALFHALTLMGCRNDDRALRELLLQRQMRREEVRRG